MKNGTLKAIVAMIMLTLNYIAYLYFVGTDGTMLGMISALLGGLGGYELRGYIEKSKK